MKIKIIDLLNKIANGEEVPKKILLNGIVFEYQGDDYLYKDEDKKEHWLFSANYTDKYMWLENFLKAEVEILDEEPKPITKESIEALGYACGEIRKLFENGWNKSLENKPLIEDPKKIEKITVREKTLGFPNGEWTARNMDKAFAIKINELIDKINNLKVEE